MKKNNHSISVIAAYQLLIMASATAGIISVDTPTPEVGDGVQNLNFSTSSADNTDHDFVPNDYIASDVNGGEALAVGQSFTTGSNPTGYELNSVSLRQVSWGPTNWDFDGGEVTVRIFEATSEDGALVFTDEILTETYAVTGEEVSTIGGTPTEPMWVTYTLDPPILLAPDSLYAFTFKSDAPIDGSSNGFLVEVDGTNTDTYDGGTSLSVPDGTGVLWKGGADNDRAFVANMTSFTVPSAPMFTEQPEDQAVAVDFDATFTCSAPADPDPTYQWEYSEDGETGWTALDGETESTLVLIFIDMTYEGYYRCVATNENGSATSDAVFLDVFYAVPEFIVQPPDFYVAAGTEVVLEADAITYDDPTMYQWYKDGLPLEGETGFSYTIPSLGPDDQGEYFCRITDPIEEGLFNDSRVASVGIVDFMVTSSAEAPTPGAEDPAFLPGLIANENLVANAEGADGGNDLYTYISHDRVSQGMSFTTGSDPLGYSLNAIIVQQVEFITFVSIPDGTLFQFAFGALDGTTKNELYRTTAPYSGTGIGGEDNGNFLTFDLSSVQSTIGTLLPNTVYYFEINIPLGVNEPAFPHIEWNGPSAGGYDGGEAFWGDDLSAITSTYLPLTGDRAFVADLNALSDPSNDYASWIAGYDVGALDGFNDDPDGDGLCNGEENFLGTDPSVYNAGVVAPSMVGDTFVFVHPQNPNPASDVSGSYRWTLDAATWNEDGATVGDTTVNFTTAPNTPEAGMTTVTATFTGTTPEKFFADLEVQQGAP